MAPESLVRKTRHAAVISMNSRSVVAPAKLCPLAARATSSHRAFSAADPKTATDAAHLGREPRSRFREPLRQPPFRGTVGRAGAHSDHRQLHAQHLESASRPSRAVRRCHRGESPALRESSRSDPRAAAVRGSRSARGPRSRRAFGAAIASVSRKLRPSRAYPTIRFTPASRTTAALSNEFGNKMARSKLPRRRRRTRLPLRRQSLAPGAPSSAMTRSMDRSPS